MAPASLLRPRFVVDMDDSFLALWPHRFDYLFSIHPDPGTKPDWHTESRHPLSDRLITQGAYLYGVRFGAKTKYALLDIDRGSPYHPRRDPLALGRIVETLEGLGLVRHLAVQSSDSGGLHLYFPFEEALPSWQVGLIISTLLTNQGFKVIPGWLEVFPNPRHYSPNGQLSLFNGHRLPLQQGSYLLNADLNPIASTHIGFVQRWHTAQAQNIINPAVLEQVMRRAMRRHYQVSDKAAKFLNDLNTEVETGWTGPGQTNHLLGRIALRSYVFGHVLYAPQRLNGDALVADIIRVARQAPGFEDWCQHQDELKPRAKAWARSVERSLRYYPYGKEELPVAQEKSGPSWNEQQRQSARLRITEGVAALIQEHNWSDGITARFDALVTQGISGSTLYRHRDLWHPKFIHTDATTPVEIPPHPPQEDENTAPSGLEGQPTPGFSQAYYSIGCNTTENNRSDREKKAATPEIGCNNADSSHHRGVPIQLKLNILAAIEAAQALQQQLKRRHQTMHEHEQEQLSPPTALIQQWRLWATSDDPILAAEGLARLKEKGLIPSQDE